MTITEFLLARIVEETEVAQYVADQSVGEVFEGDPPWGEFDWMRYSGTRRGQSAMIVSCHRVLAECEAKRRIVERHHPDGRLENWYWTQRKCVECGGRWHRWVPDKLPTDIGPEQGCPTMRALALPYAGHRDYDPSWAA